MDVHLAFLQPFTKQMHLISFLYKTVICKSDENMIHNLKVYLVDMSACLILDSYLEVIRLPTV